MLEAGQEFAHFKIIRELGAGGMGSVYLAEDQKLHREVALKILLEDFFDDAERLARFEREAKTAAQISHPNVMAIYDIGRAKLPDSDRELQYIVMERAHGRPLGEYFQSSKPDMGAVIRIASRISAGLAAAHKLNIAHRDIKSSNILVDNEGNPKILDFGLAKPIDPVRMEHEDGENTDTVSQELTRAGKIVGTVSYMSPEQARGEAVDVRTDIFSFGVLLYRMATGEFPFAGQSQVTTLAKILEGRHEPPRVKNQSVPPELERIIDKCLQKDPNDRYQAAADLTVDLRSLRRQFDSGITDSMTDVSGQFVRAKTVTVSGRKMLYAVAAVVLLSIVSLVVMNAFDSEPTEAEFRGRPGVSPDAPANGLAILHFENKTGDSALAWLETGLPEILMTDLAQSGAIPVFSTERVLDHLKSDLDLSEDIEQEIREAQQSIREAIKGSGSQGIPGVREALQGAKAQLVGLKNEPTRAEMLDAARSLGAATVLSGAFYKLGDRIRIDARLEDIASGQIVLAEKVVGDDPFTLVDSLTGKIAASLDIADKMSGTTSVAEMITSSPEAYRVYHEGMDLFSNGFNDEAITKFEAAIQIDPDFALAYMRIGMAHVFSGRTQEAAQNFALADARRNSLPVRERSLLDVYADLWLRQEFDAAFVKLKSFVENYPDDKEGRAFYGLTLWAFEKNYEGALAQCDTALMADPGFQLALAMRGQVFEESGELDSAVVCGRRLKAFHPDSPDSYLKLSTLYQKQGLIDDAIREAEQAVDLFPELSLSLRRLSNLYIQKREFGKAKTALAEFRNRVGDDPFKLGDYYYGLANLAGWEGQFREALDNVFKAADLAYTTGDTTRIRAGLTTIISYYERLDVDDSVQFYIVQSEKWPTLFSGFDAAMRMADIDVAHCDSMRAQFYDAVQIFRERVPSSWWPLAEGVAKVFETTCTSDTAGRIDALVGLAEAQQGNQGAGNLRAAGYLMVETGRFEEGREALIINLEGPLESTGGFRYLKTAYMMGRAEEGLGNREEAIRRYEEVLRFWGKPDIELEIISDTRERLARLSS